jgi:hypothetical protein
MSIPLLIGKLPVNEKWLHHIASITFSSEIGLIPTLSKIDKTFRFSGLEK